jgi:hypothetical protein
LSPALAPAAALPPPIDPEKSAAEIKEDKTDKKASKPAATGSEIVSGRFRHASSSTNAFERRKIILPPRLSGLIDF